MAAIDKIYGTTYQWDEFYYWCVKNKENACKYFYQRDGYKDDSVRPITNFPEDIDEWMLKNCTLPWVVSEIKFQYNIDQDKAEQN